MKPTLEHIELDAEISSFIYFHTYQHYFGFNMHYHEEMELTFIGNGGGKRFVGDSIDSYESTDLVLIGSNIPHTWYVEKAPNINREVVCIQFKKNFMGDLFLKLPENRSIYKILDEAKGGISFNGNDINEIGELLVGMNEQDPMGRMYSLFIILKKLSDLKSKKELCSKYYIPSSGIKSGNRIDKIFNYLHENFSQQDVNQKVASSLINLSESAFCHFFKKVTGSTFISYLNELRISYACKLLIESDDTIVTIAFKCGFNNLSNFNRRFLKLKSCTPKVFRAQTNR
ncbi:MAG: hypothetical protein COA79_05085 [Planctomycetota bacterium]|nr:MAG: hypothetical protein COA79_05085 [Planctomycetota bacterium]